MDERRCDDRTEELRDCAASVASARDIDIVQFYLWRWCQKQERRRRCAVPPTREDLRIAAARIADNLAAYGGHVERLVAGDSETLAWLRGELSASAQRAGEAADEWAAEAEQKVVLVLLTGTPPHRAAAELGAGVDGPANEYVFRSPLPFWARSIVIHLIADGERPPWYELSGTETLPSEEQRDEQVFRPSLYAGAVALPSLLRAIDRLGEQQRRAMIFTLRKYCVDPSVRTKIERLEPEMFAVAKGAIFCSDDDIAKHLGVKVGTLRQNRHLAKRALAARDPRYAMLLEALLC